MTVLKSTKNKIRLDNNDKMLHCAMHRLFCTLKVGRILQNVTCV